MVTRISHHEELCSLVYLYELGIYTIYRWQERQKSQIKGISVFTGTAKQCWEQWAKTD